MERSFRATDHYFDRYPVPLDWDRSPLGERVRVVGGGTPDRSEPRFWSGGTIPWVTPTDLTLLARKWIDTSTEKITDAGARGSNARLLPRGTVVFTTRGTIGTLGLAAVPLTSNQSCENLIPRAGLDAEYLYYLLGLLKPAFLRLGAGTTFQSVTRSDIRAVGCAIPKQESEQRAIARILDLVEELQGHAERAIGRFAALRRGVLAEFLAEGLGPVGTLSSRSRARHTDWRVESARGLLQGDPKNGLSPVASSQPPGVPTFSIAAVRDGRIDLSGGHLKFVQISESTASDYLIDKGDILIVRGNANPDLVGRCGVVDEHPDGCIYPDILKRVRFRERDDGLTPEFGALVWNHAVVHNQLVALAKSTNGTLKINSQDVKNVWLPVPPKPEQDRVVAAVQAVRRAEDIARRRVEIIGRLKRGLASDLLTGRMRLPAALVERLGGSE